MIDPATLDRLVTAMRGRDVEAAVAAAAELRRLAGVDDVPELRRLLAQEDYFFRECVGGTLLYLEGVAALPFALSGLWRGWQEGFDHDGLASAVCDWVEAHAAEAGPLLSEMIDNPDPVIRHSGVWLAGYAAPHVPFARVRTATRDQDAKVRSAAVGSVTSYPDEPGLYELLTAALDDPTDAVVRSAVGALGHLGDRRAVPVLERFRQTPSMRLFADFALKQLAR